MKRIIKGKWERFGAELAEFRDRINYSSDEMADLLKIDRRNYRMLEESQYLPGDLVLVTVYSEALKNYDDKMASYLRDSGGFPDFPKLRDHEREKERKQLARDILLAMLQNPNAYTPATAVLGNLVLNSITLANRFMREIKQQPEYAE
jgi:DNA-binding XRE family transcriptional regulator